MNRLTKTALTGTEGNDLEFEAAFGNVAYTYLQNHAPALLEHSVGFQLLDRDEDGTKAVGVFGFRINRKWVYVVLFFLNGRVRGHEMMLLRDSNMIVPLNDDWVKLLQKTPSQDLGFSETRQVSEIGASYPDLETTFRQRNFGKFAVSSNLVDPLLPLFAAVQQKRARFLYPDEGGVKGANLNLEKLAQAPVAAAVGTSANKIDLDSFINSIDRLKFAYEMSREYPDIGNLFDQFYGRDFFQKKAEFLKKEAEIREFGLTLEKKASLLDLLSPFGDLETPSSGKIKGKVRIITFSGSLGKKEDEEDEIEDLEDLDDEEKEALAQGNLVVKDARDESEVSRVFDNNTEFELEHPWKSGVYDLLDDKMKDVRCVVLTRMAGVDRSDNESCVIPMTSKYRPNICTRSDLYGYLRVNSDREFTSWFNSLPKKSKEGNVVIFVGPDGQASTTVRILSGWTSAGGEVHQVMNYTRNNNQVYHEDDKMVGFAGGDTCYRDIREVQLVKHRAGMKLVRHQDVLQVPDNFKVVVIDTQKTDSEIYHDSPESAREEDRGKFTPGSVKALDKLFRTNTQAIKVATTGGDYYLASPSGKVAGSKSQVFEALLVDHALRESDAREILKQAEIRKKVDYLIAYPESIKQARTPAGMFDYLNQSTTQVSPHRAVPTQFPQERTQTISGLQAAETDSSRYNMWKDYERKDIEGVITEVKRISETGQKEVFDLSIVSAILRSGDSESEVAKHMGTLFKTLDALGRILMVFYWHQEDFKDRYGKEQLPEIEASLKNTFESLGATVMALKSDVTESPYDQGLLNLSEVARS